MSLITPVGVDDGRGRLVRRTVVGALVLFAMTTGAMLIALVVFSEHGALVLRAYFGALALLLSLQLINVVLGAAYGSGHVIAIPPRRKGIKPPPNWPADLYQMQDRISLATVSEFDYQTRLRSLLRDVAAQRLAARWNVDLVRQPDRAKNRLGEELWNAIGGTCDDAGRRDVRGPSLARLRVLIEELERI